MLVVAGGDPTPDTRHPGPGQCGPAPRTTPPLSLSSGLSMTKCCTTSHFPLFSARFYSGAKFELCHILLVLGSLYSSETYTITIFGAASLISQLLYILVVFDLIFEVIISELMDDGYSVDK